MAARIPAGPPGPSSSSNSTLTSLKPELISKLEGGSDEVNDARLIPGQDGIITISSDRSVRVWLLRDSGQYWPSVCHYMGAAALSLAFDPPTNRIFVGVETGMVSEFVLSEDFNHMDHKRDYHAHQKGVTGLYFSHENDWILSVSKDRYFQFHCTESGRRLGGYQCPSWCTCLSWDEQAKYVFCGDFAGSITVLKLDETGVKFVNTLKGHTGSIQTLHWDSINGWLFSGSYDASVFVWDIAGRKGTMYELHGHRNKVTAAVYSGEKRILLSASEDSHLVVWNMAVKRLENPDWAESDTCQLCNRPFFWNLRAMYDQKQIGLRQHHCRKCGKAVCDGCSTKRSSMPLRGHEFPVRVCESCYIGITDDERVSHSVFHDLKHSIRSMDYDEKRGLLLTAGSDKQVKLWSFKEGSST